jgi:integrase
MSRLQLRYVQAWVDAEGRVHRYFRRAGYPRMRLPGLPGSAEFNSAYEVALAAAKPPVGASRTKPGSLDDALSRYYASSEFRIALKKSTQTQRRSVLEQLRNAHGLHPIRLLPPEFISNQLSKLEPAPASNWLKAMRHFMGFCVAHKLCPSNPTYGITVAIKSDGHHTWIEQEIAQFEAAHPIGSKARLALALGLYTAQRRGDVIRMGRQHSSGNPQILSVKQQKTGKELKIPLHPELQHVLDATPSQHLTFLVTKTGKPYSGNNFSEQFRAWCDDAGLPQCCSFHGLRKAALTRLAQAGCSVHEIAAISGHRTLKEIERYTRDVDQARLAGEAMARMVNRTVNPDQARLSKPLQTLHKKSGR